MHPRRIVGERTLMHQLMHFCGLSTLLVAPSDPSLYDVSRLPSEPLLNEVRPGAAIGSELEKMPSRYAVSSIVRVYP